MRQLYQGGFTAKTEIKNGKLDASCYQNIMKSRKYQFSIGIDVSKATLDFVIIKERISLSHHKITNSPEQIIELLARYKQIQGFKKTNTIIGLEKTGIYSNHLIEVLSKLKFNFTVINSLHLKRSLGLTRGKNDKIDAERIANYLYSSADLLKLWEPKRQIIQQLARLSSLRNRLITINAGLKKPLKEQASFLKASIAEKYSKLCLGSLQALDTDIQQVQELIKSTWSSDEKLKRLMEIIISVPSVGEVTALEILITTNEFKDISTAKKFACYAGVAPFDYSSGTSVNKRTRISRIANRKIKALLHTCAMCARSSVPDLKAYFERKTQTQGKAKMLVLNAIRFKLIARIFSCVNADRVYQKQPPIATQPTELTPASI